MIDIVIPTYNNLSQLKRCLCHFENQTVKDFRIFICIDGSTDGTADYLKLYTSELSVKILEHKNKANMGRSATRNLSLDFADSEYIMFFDSDLWPDKNLVKNHLRFLEDYKVSVGNILYQNTTDNIWNRFIQKRGKNKFLDNDKIPPHYLTTGNVALSNHIFRKLKGFDENIRFYGTEDADLGCRINKIFGSEILFNKNATAISDTNKTIPEVLNQMEELGRENLDYFISKNPEAADYFNTHLFTQNSKIKWFFQFLFNPVFCKVLEKFVSVSPDFLSFQIIKFLVFAHLFKGYYSNKIS